jgi:hypothetical protein
MKRKKNNNNNNKKRRKPHHKNVKDVEEVWNLILDIKGVVIIYITRICKISPSPLVDQKLLVYTREKGGELLKNFY